MDRKCQHCGAGFSARPADVKRGWARFCSKSCKAKAQGHLPRSLSKWERQELEHEEAMEGSAAGWDEGGWRD